MGAGLVAAEVQQVSELPGMVSQESLNCSLICAMFWMMVLQEMFLDSWLPVRGAAPAG